MKKLFAGAIVSALLGGGAPAADISVPPPAYRPIAAVSRFIWTGCYFGANAGGLWVRNDATFGSPPYVGSPALGTSLGGHAAGGWLAGVQMGCNYQVGNWVFGAQGGFDWADAKGSHPDPFFALTTDTSRTRQFMEMTAHRVCLGSLARLREGRRRLGADRLRHGDRYCGHERLLRARDWRLDRRHWR